MNLKTINLRDPELTIPCPTRKRNIVDGDVVDLDQPYWARILGEGDIVLVPTSAATTQSTGAKAPATSKE